MPPLLQRFLLVLLIVFSFSGSAFAQIGGIVKNSEDLTPISDVNINVLNYNSGTSTNEEGEFFIDWGIFPVEIQFTALGYESITLLFESADTLHSVYLEPSFLDLEEIVVVPDRTINPITNSSPIARSSVSIEQLSDKSVTTAVELLRAETGVYVQQTSVGQGSLYIRGRAGRDVLYLFNGFRMNPSFVRSGQNQYFGAVDPFLISKLDVYRGPVSVYYGSDALSGGVNITPIIKNFDPDVELSGEVSTFLNLEGNGEKSIHGKLAHQGRTFTLFVGGSYRDYDYYNMSSRSNEALWFPYDETLANADYEFKSYQISSRIKVTDYSNISLVSYNGQIPDAPRLDRQTLGFSIEEPVDGLQPRNGYYSNTSPLVFWGNTAEYRFQDESGLLQSVGVKFGFFRLKDFRRQQDYDVDNPPAFSVNHDERDYSFLINDTTNYDRNTSNQFLASFDVQNKLTKNIYLKWGGDISFDQIKSRGFTNFGDENLSRYPNNSNYNLGGLFTQIDYLPFKNLALDYGIRYSKIFAEIPFEGIKTERNQNRYSDSFSHLTHAFGLSYKISDQVTLMNNISNGFRAPNVADLSEVGIRRNDQFQTSNTDLDPETTRNIDIGIHFENDFYSVEMYSFWLHYSDKITRVETGRIVNELGQEVNPEDNVQLWNTYNEVKNVNASSMDLLGLEFAGEYTNNDFVTTGITFTYTWGDLTNDDGSTEPVDRIPPANGLFYVQYTPAENISIRPQARYAFSHRRISPAEIDDNRVSQNGTDGFVNLQLLFNIQPQENVAIKFLADNIMDEAYREHSSSLDGMGRNFTISISYTF